MKVIHHVLCVVAAAIFVIGCADAKKEQQKSSAKAGPAKSVDTSASVTEGSSESKEAATAAVKAPVTDSKNAESKNAESKKPETTDPVDSSADSKSAESTSAEPTAAVAESGDWTMWGGAPGRNMVNSTKGVSIDFDPETKKNLLWTAKLGSQTYGNPVVGNGKILVGTNNGGGYRPKHPPEEDRGVVVCFDEKSGDFVWQLTRKKLPIGRVSDWPLQGICSCPVIEGDKSYVITNRAELVCLDMDGFADGENDGPFTAEEDSEEGDADIIWSLDLIEELGVFPHNLATSSPVIYKDHIFLVTSNGVDESHKKIPARRAPSFLCVNKNSGKVVWEDGSPGREILHGQWSSPSVGVVNGKAQVYMPGGDGWLYAFDAESTDETPKLVWKFDLNPKEAVWKLGGEGDRNAVIGTPVFFENSVILGVGQDPEHGNGVGHLYRIDATKSGDISPELGEIEEPGKPNPNSGQIWHYGGVDEDGSVTGEKEEAIYSRTVSTVAVHGGLLYAADLYGILHCLDYETGKRVWALDTFAAIWGSPMVVDGKVFLGTEDNDVWIMEAGREMKELKKVQFDSSVYTTPSIANGVMYVSDRSTLYAIDIAE